MIEDRLLPDKLKTFDYYVNKLPMYLQQSNGFIEHFRIWYDLLVGKINEPVNTFGVNSVGNILFNLLNIFDQDNYSDGSIHNKYLEDLVRIGDAGTINEDNQYGTQSDILDKLGLLFGVKREFEVKYVDSEGNEQTHHLSLNNEEFLILIKAQIIKNYCDGSYIQLKEYYESIGLYVYLVTANEPATCNVYLAYSETSSIYVSSPNVQKMFLAGLLTIKSMGISYKHAYVSIQNILIWLNAQDDDDVVYDEDGWAEIDTIEETSNGGQWVI